MKWILALFLVGCAEIPCEHGRLRAHDQNQHCADVCSERHGAFLYSWVEHREQCYCRLFNQQMTYEGHLN